MVNNSLLWNKLNEHWGHNVRISRYGDEDNPANVCLECDDCGTVVLDAELYTLCAQVDETGNHKPRNNYKLLDNKEEDSMETKKYCVTISRTGCVFVEAKNESEAMDIADHLTTDDISWSDDWCPTDAEEDDGSYGGDYITKGTFE